MARTLRGGQASAPCGLRSQAPLASRAEARYLFRVHPKTLRTDRLEAGPTRVLGRTLSGPERGSGTFLPGSSPDSAAFPAFQSDRPVGQVPSGKKEPDPGR